MSLRKMNLPQRSGQYLGGIFVIELIYYFFFLLRRITITIGSANMF